MHSIHMAQGKDHEEGADAQMKFLLFSKDAIALCVWRHLLNLLLCLSL